MGSSDYYDCSPENAQGAVITNDVKGTIDNTKALFSYLLLIGVHIFIIYFGINFFDKSDNINILVLLSMLFMFFMNIIFYRFGSAFKLFYYKIFGLSGVLVTIVYTIIYIVNKPVELNTLFTKIVLNDRAFALSVTIAFVFLIIFMLLLIWSSVRGTSLHKKKQLKLLPTWATLGIMNDIILFFILWIKLSDNS
jgi:hypothetical protein